MLDINKYLGDLQTILVAHCNFPLQNKPHSDVSERICLVNIHFQNEISVFFSPSIRMADANPHQYN